MTYATGKGQWKGISKPPKGDKWQWTLGVWEAIGTQVTDSTGPVSTRGPHHAGATGPASLVFQKKLES